MRRPHPTTILLLALLFAGQTVAAVAVQCQEVQDVASHDCCGETTHQSTAADCGCYDVPVEPTPAPAVQAQTTQIAATLSPSTDTNPESNPRRVIAVEPADLPAPPPLRAHDVRAPPISW